MITYILVFCFNYMIDEKCNVKVDTGLEQVIKRVWYSLIKAAEELCWKQLLALLKPGLTFVRAFIHVWQAVTQTHMQTRRDLHTVLYEWYSTAL